MADRTYLCIDLKSFYASVECVERGLDPMATDLVVADPDRSERTICLAVSPSLKARGVRNRCRVFEIPKNISYIMAPPRMQKYIDYAANIYALYLRYFSKDDVFVYSIDEVFLDVTPYLSRMKMTGKEIAVFLMDRIAEEIGVRATAGVGTNLYLAKVALDITAKHAEDFIGVLDEEQYRKTLWDHRPLTDFWRVGAGLSRRLADRGLFTMRMIAMADPEILYHMIGVDAELLIDHAWGREPTTIADIKAYRPRANGMSSGQVLMRDYSKEEGEIIVREMTDLFCLDMAERGVLCRSLSLSIGFAARAADAPVSVTVTLPEYSSADRDWIPAVAEAYRRAVSPGALIRRVSLSCGELLAEEDAPPAQLSLFAEGADRSAILKKDNKKQKTVIAIKEKFGKDAMLRGLDLEEAATARERNHQIGGHKSGN